MGSHLLLELTRTEDRVRAIRRSSSDIRRVRDVFAFYLEDPGARYNKIEWVDGDTTDPQSLLEAMEGVQDVYHAAANVSVVPGRNKKLMHNNVGGTANVVNTCLEKQVRKLCFISSTAALGSVAPDEMITEDTLWSGSKKRSLYSVSKFNSELEVWRGMAEGLQAVIVNPSIVIGPGDWNRSSAYLFKAVWKGMKFYTEGTTGYVDVRDVVRAMTELMKSKHRGERFTVSAENLSYRRVLEMIAEALGRKPPHIHARPLMVSAAWRLDWLASQLTGKTRSITRDAAVSSQRKALFSNRKIREATGMEFIPIDRSIRDTAQIFLREIAVDA